MILGIFMMLAQEHIREIMPITNITVKDDKIFSNNPVTFSIARDYDCNI